jgi:hypothetical protein
MKNELLEHALATLRQAGIEPRVVCNRHWKINWIDQHGRTRLLVVSLSPSNRRAWKRSRATLRRLLLAP